MSDKRTPLGPIEFINAAMALVDKNGIAALSIRALGSELGVDASPHEKCISMALALRNAFRRHPHIGISLVHSEGVSNNDLEFSRRVAQCLREMGLSGIDLVRQCRSFRLLQSLIRII